eukprot:CAMPEP_0115832230 /NCGR_PEP_ID=MMETSP0287-20121206/2550_1 /TAXON_ID=412157 /ORGANISM="Chrysochromulina rotalis, Strain UIO044" /LENGTH=162 /DNA_ID=CAMNT_0003285607 /DNA_START=40 /DNA_END=528 /DNA_ORIENTATION=+
MVCPQDYATDTYHRSPLRAPRQRNPFTSSRADSIPWVLNRPPSPMSTARTLDMPSYQLTFRHRNASSIAYEPFNAMKANQLAPSTWQMHATTAPRTFWATSESQPLRSATRNVCTPSQRSLSTFFGTSALDGTETGWSSMGSRPGSTIGSMRSSPRRLFPPM